VVSCRALSTKLLLSASALVLGLAGMASTFLPQEIATALGLHAERTVIILFQIVGACFLAFAMMNWTARGSLIGGIYNRSVAIANLTHFMIGGIGLLKIVAAGDRRMPIVIAATLYTLFALGFARVFFSSPVTASADRQ
jgi:hypothetical protein